MHPDTSLLIAFTAGSIFGVIVSQILLRVMDGKPLKDDTDEGADAERAVDYCGIVVVGPGFHDPEITDG